MNLPNKPTDSQLYDACLNYRHDYGLLTPPERVVVRDEALEWYEAWRKALETKENYGTVS